VQKFDVQIALEGVADARHQWSAAQREFQADIDKVLDRLIHEAAVNFMSPEEFARYSGLSTNQVRALMMRNGLNRSKGKTLLAKTAADALATNAELLGITPHEMDLTSPLAYLPMGKQLRQQLQDRSVSKVTELDDDVSGNVTPAVVAAFKAAWHEANERGEEGHRVEAGLAAALAALR
jgi:hypothetical protein